MSLVFELVVRREHTIFTPLFHVTVATLDPITVVAAFDIQPGTNDPAAAAEAAMERLRPAGYRLTEAVETHDYYATARLARDERQVAAVELAADLVADARAVTRALVGMGTPEGAAEVVRLVDDLVASAQALRARAHKTVTADEAVEVSAVLDHAMTALDEISPAQQRVHAELERRRAELGGQ